MFSKEHDISTGTLLKVTALVLILFFLWQIRDVLIILLIAITFASALEPMVEALSKKGIPRAASVLSVYLIVIGLVGLFTWMVVPQMLSQLNQLKNVDEIANELQSKFGKYEILSNTNWHQLISSNIQGFLNQSSNLSGAFLRRTLGFFTGFIEAVTILVISFYLLAERNGMKNFIYTLMPKRYEAQALHLVSKAQRRIGRWLIGQLILSAVMFTISYVALTLLGIKFALILALMVGFFELIPYIGPIIAAIPAIFFAFLQSPTLAVVVAVLYVVFQKTEAYILVPKVMQRSIGASPLVILLAVLIGYKVAGIFGTLLAIPIVAVINVVIEEWDTLKTLRTAEVNERE